MTMSLLACSRRPTVARRLTVERRRTRDGVPLIASAIRATSTNIAPQNGYRTRRPWMRTNTTAIATSLHNPHNHHQQQRLSYSTMTGSSSRLLNPYSFSVADATTSIYQHHNPWEDARRCLSSLPDSEYDHDDFLNEEMERLAQSCFGTEEYFLHDDNKDGDAAAKKRGVDKQEQLRRMEPLSNNLDLELGESSVWDGPGATVVSSTEQQPHLDDDDDDDDTKSDNPLDFPEFPKGSPAAEWHRQQMDKPQEYVSPLDLLQAWQMDDRQQQLEGTTDPWSKREIPQTLEELKLEQLKLECHAQREAVLRYQKATDSTRSRQDYATLSSMQRLILNWFQPVRDAIQQRQTDYIINTARMNKLEHIKRRKKKAKAVVQKNKTLEEEEDSDGEGDSDFRAIKRYGPYLCAVDPEKMAVIAMHHALTQTIELQMRSTNRNESGSEGAQVLALAQALGKAVEEEVLLQRVLKKTMEDERERRKQEEGEDENSGGGKTGSTENSAVADFAAETLGNTNDNTAKDDKANKLTKPWSYAESRLNSFLTDVAGGVDEAQNAKTRRNIKYAIGRARRVLNHEDWTMQDHVQVGAVLLQIVIEHATIRLPDGSVQPAFRHERRWELNHGPKLLDFEEHIDRRVRDGEPRFKSKAYIVLNEAVLKMAVSDDFESIAAVTTRYKPMVVPPKPWTAPNRGGYEWLQADLVRFHQSQMQREALNQTDLSTVLDGLNVLGQQPWVINKAILEVAQQCWDRNIALGDIPSRTDLIEPPEPIPPEGMSDEALAGFDEEQMKIRKDMQREEWKSFYEAKKRYRRVRQKNGDMFSLRCSAQLKLGQAEQFKDYEKLYFPYNMDFRGRAYPVPPHLSNVGSDLCRGLLMFAEKKPLGKRGLFWLQVHLANLAGKDKMSFEQRAQYTIDNLELVRASVKDPFGDNSESDERPWWMGLDDPFQGLATCYEIINAIDSGDPENYMCGLTVHMDGSCNGLQHYAALGRDRVGGTAVNLCDYDEPQDVYIGVMHEVIRRVAAEAERQLEFSDETLGADETLSMKQKKELAHNRAAKLVNGLIDRGVVKRTVMTSVYGVTYIGARTQIHEKIEEKLEEQGHDLDEIDYELFRASGYLAAVTMDVMGDLFSGARQTMDWLTHCARLIAREGYPVAWMTPLGLPAIQPYRERRTSRVVTVMHAFNVMNEPDELPIHKTRSVSAFPPNYIHSLDSSHMLLTALEMDRRGLSFSAVHDSFWTHACDVDELNGALRDVFVELYSRPLLEQLKASFEIRYPNIEFPDLPKRGDLDLQEVKKSKFFFQ